MDSIVELALVAGVGLKWVMGGELASPFLCCEVLRLRERFPSSYSPLATCSRWDSWPTPLPATALWRGPWALAEHHIRSDSGGRGSGDLALSLAGWPCGSARELALVLWVQASWPAD